MQESTGEDGRREIPMINLDYVAGLFDGEGHVYISRSKPRTDGSSPRYVVKVGLSNTCLPVLDRIKEEFGGSISKQTIKVNLTCWTWEISAKTALRFLEEMVGRCLIKRSQIWEAIETQRFISRRGFGPLREDEVEFLEKMRTKIKILKEVDYIG